jgi:hypothetical protein
MAGFGEPFIRMNVFFLAIRPVSLGNERLRMSGSPMTGFSYNRDRGNKKPGSWVMHKTWVIPQMKGCYPSLMLLQ